MYCTVWHDGLSTVKCFSVFLCYRQTQIECTIAYSLNANLTKTHEL